MIGAADGLYQEINKKLGTLKEHRVNKDSILKCLDNNSDAISAQIKAIIEKATAEPKWTMTEIQDRDPVAWPHDWDRSESWVMGRLVRSGTKLRTDLPPIKLSAQATAR